MYKNEADYQKGILLQKKIVKIIKDIAHQEEETKNTVATFPYFVRGKRDTAKAKVKKEEEDKKKKTGRKLLNVPAHLKQFVEGEAAQYVDDETLNSIDYNNEEAVKELKEFVRDQQNKNAEYEFGFSVKVSSTVHFPAGSNFPEFSLVDLISKLQNVFRRGAKSRFRKNNRLLVKERDYFQVIKFMVTFSFFSGWDKWRFPSADRAAEWLAHDWKLGLHRRIFRVQV